jgi:hypothetical protein
VPAHAATIVFDGQRATGVEYVQDGQRRVARSWGGRWRLDDTRDGSLFLPGSERGGEARHRAALLGTVADWKGIGFVFQICAFLPAIGILTVFLPNLREHKPQTT